MKNSTHSLEKKSARRIDDRSLVEWTKRVRKREIESEI